MMMNHKELQKYGQEWNNRLKTCQYAGEIYLEEAELLQITELLKNSPNVIIDRETYSTIILIVAVNSAYYYYDEDGFWKHFIELTGIDSTSDIGNMLEKKLRSLGLLKVQRSGPFRYVGSILEQCGISKRYTESFAKIIRDMKDKLGWNRLLRISKPDLINRLNDFYCAAFLKNFLLDPEGLKFTLQVCHLIKMYEDGVMSQIEIRSLSGFRPGFWDEVISYFNASKTGKNNFDSIFRYKPRIFLDIYKKNVGISFPSSEYHRGMDNNEGFTYPVTIFNDYKYFRPSYKGSVSGLSGQSVNWDILGLELNGLPIVFERESRYLIDSQQALTQGEYYILIPDSYDIPDNILIRSLGHINISMNRPYSINLIKINYGDHLKHIKILGENSGSEVIITWRKGEENILPFHSYLTDVFLGKIPELSISDFTPIKNNVIGLFYELSDGTVGRMRSKSDIDVFYKLVNNNAPLRGRIWITTLSRSRSFFGEYKEITFCLLPNLVLPELKKAYGMTEEIIFEVYDPSRKCSIKINNCAPIGKKDKQVWKLEKQRESIDGEIITENFQVGFSIPVLRFGITDMAGSAIKYIQFGTKNIPENNFNLKGHSEIEFVLQIGSKPITNGVFQNQSYKLQTSDLVRNDFNYAAINRLYLVVSGEIVDTGTNLVNLEKLKHDILFDDEKLASPKDNIVLVNNVIRSLLMNPTVPINFSMQPSVFPEFDEWMHTIFACASILDKNTITVNGNYVNWIDKLIDKQMIGFFKSIESEEIVHELLEYAVSKSEIVSVRRWKEKIDRFKIADTIETRFKQLQDWSLEVQEGKFTIFTSDLAKARGGLIVSQSWSSYLKNRDIDAFRRIGEFTHGNATMIALKHILHATVLMRQARFVNACKVLESDWSDYTFTPLKELITRYLLGLPIDKGTIHNDSVLLQLINFLPLRPDDKALYTNLSHAEKGKEAIVNLLSNDWLNNWLIFNRCLSDRKKESGDIALRLLFYKDNIPKSPEKENMLGTIQMYIRSTET
ncbi:hypothetical protein SAMN03159341_101434 [Paenibacillus sp. 1_12]|uniref:hypothetical protein n=1 Tax=Paenibacillus sp. 1_12 TaxID=1566278 RepID=UPI0008E5D19D|nr:hypothetical protein [Paenibacillus sp. 1_12]SFK75727.1 hypothetical protein SAMN03159341_101434 [Paenibacillus sp. 1_12]